MTRTVILIDPLNGGHHAGYVERACVALVERGVRVGVVAGDARGILERVQARCNPEPGQVTAHEYAPITPWPSLPFRLRTPMEALGRWWQARLWVNRVGRAMGVRNPFVLFAWLDSYLDRLLPATLVDALFPFDWAGIWFHPRSFRVGDPGVRKAATRVLRARRCRGVGLLDEGVSGPLKEFCGGRPVVHLPDVADDAKPAPDFPPAAEIRRQGAGRCVVGLVGSIAARKGVSTLLDAAERMDPERWLFVLAGAPAERTFRPEQLARLRALAEAPAAPVLAHFARIPGEAEFNAVVDACDILFAAYDRFPHSSNILAKAALFAKPVVVSKGYCMAEQVERYGLGLAIDEGDSAQCVAALERIRKDLEGGRTDFGFEAFVRDHMPEQFERAVVRLVTP
jgi:glycosyltransferase involved in cell wall biosynthesis